MEKDSQRSDALVNLISDTPARLSDAVASTLSFYGSETTSHGSLAVGFVVAFFTLFQVRSGLDAALFSMALFTVAFGGIYSVFRTIHYGSLSSGLIYASLPRIEDTQNTFPKEMRSQVYMLLLQSMPIGISWKHSRFAAAFTARPESFINVSGFARMSVSVAATCA